MDVQTDVDVTPNLNQKHTIPIHHCNAWYCIVVYFGKLLFVFGLQSYAKY